MEKQKELLTIDEAIFHCQGRAKADCSECAREHEQLSKWLEELRKYRDLEEQGLLLRLPCKVGDTVYTNVRAVGWHMREKNKPYKAEIAFIGINGKDNFVNVVLGNGNMLQFKFSDFGKTIFLTREEAEAALEKMNNNNLQKEN